MLRYTLLLIILFSLVSQVSISSAEQFNALSAFSYLEKQVSFGPRYPGSKGHFEAKKYLIAELRRYADRVDTQNFTSFGYQLTNIIAIFSPEGEAKERILLAAHWDTRPHADEDPSKKRRSEPVIGANDGASGVAVLLEIARILSSQDLEREVIIVLFDGEDAGTWFDPDNPLDNDWLLGSKYFAKNMSQYLPDYAILIDMIGDKDLNIHKERYSLAYAPDIVDMVWNTAQKLGYHQFEDIIGSAIMDDHLPLIVAGVKCIDIIDFDYPYWHTTGDTSDKCSPESLRMVGEVLLDIILR